MVLQALTDAVTALTATTKDLITKVDGVVAGSATPAEQQALADALGAVNRQLSDEIAKLG